MADVGRPRAKDAPFDNQNNPGPGREPLEVNKISMRRFNLVLLLAVFALSLCIAPPARARVYIDVTQPFSRKLPLALAPFEPLAGEAVDPAGQSGARLLQSDLSFTGLFDFLDPRSFLGKPQVGRINYARWSKVGAELLITGNYRLSGGTMTLEMRLYDVGGAKLLVGRRYDGRMADLPAMMHRFADEVMLAVTGERSVFSSAIAFVGARQVEVGGKRQVHKEIYLMNFDGSGARRFTQRRDICLYPAWSPDGKLLAYSSYVKRRPAIFVHALAGGAGRILINKPGVNLTPDFRPHSQQIAASLSHTGKTNIFLVSLAGKIIKKLTDGWGIEVAPSFSPDGKRMAFVSDRAGNPQIYVLHLNDGSIRRLTFGLKYCAAPSWSPRGDRIAFQGQIDGTFQVVTMNPRGGDMQVLTHGWGGGEDPSWSPDGRLIAYSSRKTGRYQIYVMTANGQPIKRLTNFLGDNTDPAWSPRGVAGR